MKKLLVIFSLTLSFSALAEKIKPDALMKSYSEVGKEAEATFQKIAEKDWSQTYHTLGKIIYLDAPTRTVDFGYSKDLKFSLSKEKKNYYFSMIGGTWEGSDTSYPSHGGGYSRAIPVKHMGFKQDGSKVSFYFLGREDYYVEKNAHRMFIDVLHPALNEVEDTEQLTKILEKDPLCLEDKKNNPYFEVMNCAIIKDIRFDYLTIDADLESLDTIRVVGRNLNNETPVFSFEMKIKPKRSVWGN